MDWDANLTRDEIQDAIRPIRTGELEGEKTAASASLDFQDSDVDFSPVILDPDEPELKNTRRISLTITESNSIKEVLMEIARLAELELALDPNINRGIILSVNNRPVNEVLDTICELAGLRYSVDSGVLKVMRDDPYSVNYNVDFLNINRSGKGSSSAKSNATSSDTSLNNSYDGDLWKSITANLQAMLEFPEYFKASTDSRAMSAAPAVAAANNNEPGSAAPSAPAPVAPSAQSNDPYKNALIVNQQAGLITVITTDKKHKAIKEYLDKIQNSVSGQVLIEAKILEVILNKEYAMGIDWAKITSQRLEGSFLGGTTSPAKVALSNNNSLFSQDLSGFAGLGATAAPANALLFKNGAGTITSIISAIEGFGMTRSLSNPRITVLNNQQALLNFAKNELHYELTIAGGVATTSGTGSSATTTTTPITVNSKAVNTPVGVTLSLQPSIDFAKNEVSMHIRPTVTAKLSDGQQDPAVQYLQATAVTTGSEAEDALKALSSRTPIMEVREIDTMLKAKSGDVMVIGGLIQHKDHTVEVGIPGLASIPILGNLAKRSETSSVVTETVILIQATIIPPSKNIHKHDKKLYETFAQDPRSPVFKD